MIGLLSRFQKNMNCIQKNDISSAIRELYDTEERVEKAFAEREAEIRMGGNIINEVKLAKSKIKMIENAPVLPGLEDEE